MARKKKEPASKAEWRRLPEVEQLVKQLVEKFHKHLERATIAVLGKPKAGKHHGKRVEATVRKPTAAMNALMADDVGELHYLVEIGLDLWGELDQQGKRRVLDKALCHFTGLDDKGAWQVIGPDIEEFTEHVKRWGAYNSELEIFFAAIKQMDLPGTEGP